MLLTQYFYRLNGYLSTTGQIYGFSGALPNVCCLMYISFNFAANATLRKYCGLLLANRASAAVHISAINTIPRQTQRSPGLYSLFWVERFGLLYSHYLPASFT